MSITPNPTVHQSVFSDKSFSQPLIQPLFERVSQVSTTVFSEQTSQREISLPILKPATPLKGFSYSCLSGLLTGTIGSYFTENRFPLLLGIVGCFSLAHSQQPIGSQFQVNTNTTKDQYMQAVAPLSNRNFVVIWEDDSGLDGYGYGIFGQVFNANGTKFENQFQANTYTNGNQVNPKVTGLSNGNFVVTWTDESGEDGSDYGVFGQIFAPNSTKIENQFQVNTKTIGEQFQSSVAALNDSNFIVTWTDNNGLDGSGYGVFGQIFNANSTKIGSQFQVNTYTSGSQWFSTVANLSNGDFVVAWTDESGSGSNIFGQIFNTNSTHIGSQFQVNTLINGTQESPTIAGLSNGDFVVAWTDGSSLDGSLSGVFGQVFHANSSKIQNQFQINTYTTGDQWGQTLAGLSHGNFVATWMDQSGLDGSGAGVFGQIFNTNSTKIGSQFQVNSYTSGYQGVPTVSALNNSNFVVAWTDESGEDGSGYGVFAQIFNGSVILQTSNISTGSPTTSFSTTAASTGTGPITSNPTTSTTGVLRSSKGSNHSISWLGPVLGVIGGVSCLGTTAFFLYKRMTRFRKQSDQAELENRIPAASDALSPSRTEGHTVIGGRYELMTKISRDEAADLYQQTGIQIDFPDGKNKTKFLIGSGNFGKLRVARHLETKEFVAVKKIKGADGIQESKNEGALQSKLEGKSNILPILDFVESLSSEKTPVLYQFMFLAGYGNGEVLKTYLQSAPPDLKEQILTHVAQGLLTGLQHMHQANIYHLDLKPANMVIDRDGEVYIIDFGCAKELGEGWINERALGDTRYFSAERIAFARQLQLHAKPTPIDPAKVDAWTLGVTLLELALGAYPFDQCTFVEKLSSWNDSYFEQKLAHIPQLNQSHGIWPVVKGLLDTNPERRLSIEEARLRLGQNIFADLAEQKTVFTALKEGNRANLITSLVPRDENENYEDVYMNKYGSIGPSLDEDYGGIHRGDPNGYQ